MGMIPVKREEIVDDISYVVVLPTGKTKTMHGSRVKTLPHWKHCRAERESTYKYEIYLRVEDGVIAGERVFMFGRARTAMIDELHVQRDRVASTQALIHRSESDLLGHKALQESLRQQFVAQGRARKANIEIAKGKFSIEQLRETLLAQEDILDVRFGGEPNFDQNMNITGTVSADVMLVTFIGPSIHYGSHGVCPIPPIQFQFFLNGRVVGGNLAIHPHAKTNDMCYGNADRAFGRIVELGDTYAAVDMVRMYRLGYDSTSPLVREWKNYAWTWWATRFSRGWPEKEPFMKPWMSSGFLVQDNARGKIIPLASVLGTDDPKKMLTAIHIGLQNGWYNRKTWVAQLGDLSVYRQVVSATNIHCACGRTHPEDVVGDRIERPVCACHGVSSEYTYSQHPCPSCGREARNCRCAWYDRAAWVQCGMSVYCEAPLPREAGASTRRTICHEYGSSSLQMFHLSGVHPGYLGGLIMCANHLPDAPDAVHCPDCLSDHPAGACPLMPVAAAPVEGVTPEPELEEELYCPSCDEYGHVEDDHDDDPADEEALAYYEDDTGEEDVAEDVPLPYVPETDSEREAAAAIRDLLTPITTSSSGGDFVP